MQGRELLLERKRALEESIASGVMSISVDGQSTTFASLAERQRVLNEINDILNTNTKRPRAAQVYLGGFQ